MSLKNFSKLWLLFFICASLIAAIFTRQIQSHHLSRSLEFGFDPLGRNCILLTLNAATQCIIDTIPIGFFSVCLALVLSFFTMIKNTSFQFFWHTFFETIYSLPGFFIALSITAFLPDSMAAFTTATLFLLVPYLIRFYEGQIQHIMNKEFYKQAVALGGGVIYLFTKHIFPELMSGTKSILPFLFTRLIIIETSLTFIGSKQPRSIMSWGELLYLAKDYLLEAPWISFFISFPLFLTLFSFHLLSQNEPS